MKNYVKLAICLIYSNDEKSKKELKVLYSCGVSIVHVQIILAEEINKRFKGTLIKVNFKNYITDKSYVSIVEEWGNVNGKFGIGFDNIQEDSLKKAECNMMKKTKNKLPICVPVEQVMLNQF